MRQPASFFLDSSPFPHEPNTSTCSAFLTHNTMAPLLNTVLAAGMLLLAAPTVAHPGHKEEVYAHSALPLERKSLAHCSTKFNEPAFVKKTVQIHGRELARLRRARGIDVDASLQK